jgi:hypothetical protein
MPGQSAAASPEVARPGTLMESVMPMEQELGACSLNDGTAVHCFHSQ